jgi:hypothetical protein
MELAVSVKLDDGRLRQVIFALQALGDMRLPETAKSVFQSTEIIQRRWIDNAKGAFLHSTGGYLLAIQDGLQYPFQGDIYKGAVVNTAPYAIWVEKGTPPHDMKKALHTSAKARRAKDGTLYLIIPFRHGTPSAGVDRATMQTMPKEIYAMAKALPMSVRTGSYNAISPNTGGSTARHTYAFGGRLTKADVGNWGQRSQIAPKYTWKSSPYQGMVRFPQGKTGSEYITFRVMSEKSKGWFHGGTAPKPLAAQTAQQTNPVCVALINAGFKRDLQNLLAQA